MSRLPPFFHWLTLAALADWLIGRTVARLAIFMPKSPPVIAVYQALGFVGQLAATLTGLLALGALGWVAWRERRDRGGIALPLALIGLGGFSLLSLVSAPSGWLTVGGHLLTLMAAGMIVWRMRRGEAPASRRIAVLLPALAFLIGVLYQIGPAWYQALRWPGPPSFSGDLFNLGELLVVLSPIGLWWAYRLASRGNLLAYTVAALPALAFSAMYVVNPALISILSIWSVGLTLYLPWLLYAMSLWLAGATVIVLLRQRDPAGPAILLLATAGYTPQLSTQVFLGLIALWMLALAAAQPAVAYRRSVGRLVSSPHAGFLIGEGTNRP